MSSNVTSERFPDFPPFPPPMRPELTPRAALMPPTVYVAPSWEYKHVTRTLSEEALLTEAELNALGKDGWELTGIVNEHTRVHFYFKRARD